MNTIWKFEVPLSEWTEVQMPDGAHLLHWGHQDDHRLCVWAMVDPEEGLVTRRFRIIGTGWPVGPLDHVTYLTTVQMPGRQGFEFVWHVFEA